MAIVQRPSLANRCDNLDRWSGRGLGAFGLSLHHPNCESERQRIRRRTCRCCWPTPTFIGDTIICSRSSSPEPSAFSNTPLDSLQSGILLACYLVTESSLLLNAERIEVQDKRPARAILPQLGIFLILPFVHQLSGGDRGSISLRRNAALGLSSAFCHCRCQPRASEVELARRIGLCLGASPF